MASNSYTVSSLQTGFNVNSWIQFESTSNSLQSHLHNHFAMQIGSLTDCTCTHAALTGADDCHDMAKKRQISINVLSGFCGTVLLASLCNASKKQVKEGALDIEEAAEKIIFFEEATGV